MNALLTATRTLNVVFVADIVCPWCYLGWRKLQIALERRPSVAADIVWAPFQLSPDKPLEGVDRPSMMRRFMPGPGEVEASYAKFKMLGAEVGVDMRSAEIPLSPNTAASHRLLMWAHDAGLQTQAIDAVFAAYWTQLRDVGSVEVLADIAQEIGMDRTTVLTRFQAGEDADRVADACNQAVRAAITGVPCILFDNRVAARGAEAPERLVERMDIVLGETA